MRHRRSGRKFSRNTKARAALLRALSASLVRDGKVVTTHQKARELQRLADSLLTTARKSDTLSARRQLHAYFGKRDIANTLVDRYVPLLAKYPSGVTKITILGPRSGDNAILTQVDWMEPVTQTGLNNPNPIERTAKRSSKHPSSSTNKAKQVKSSTSAASAQSKKKSQSKAVKVEKTKTAKTTV